MLSIEFIDENKTSSIIEWNEDTRILTVEPKAKISFKVKQNEDSLDNLTSMNKASWALYNFNTLFTTKGCSYVSRIHSISVSMNISIE